MATIVNLEKNKPGNYTEQISHRAHIGSIHTKESKSKRKKPATSEKENFIVRSLRPPQASKCVCVCIFPYKCPCVRKTKLVLVAPPRRVFFWDDSSGFHQQHWHWVPYWKSYWWRNPNQGNEFELGKSWLMDCNTQLRLMPPGCVPTVPHKQLCRDYN